MFSTGCCSRLHAAVAIVVLVATSAVPAAAQHSNPGLREVHDIGVAGINLVVGLPQGDFKRNVDVAGGIDLFGALNLGRGGALSMRLDGSYLAYGSDYQIISQPYYPVAIHTTYSIATFSVGPQITLSGSGPVRLYGFGTFGASYLWAGSSYAVDGCGCGAVSTAIAFDDWTEALQAGGGVLVSLRARHTPVALDLGARYLTNQSVWYVPPGGVVPQPNGTVAVFPTHARADLILLHLGVSVRIR